MSWETGASRFARKHCKRLLSVRVNGKRNEGEERGERETRVKTDRRKKNEAGDDRVTRVIIITVVAFTRAR